MRIFLEGQQTALLATEVSLIMHSNTDFWNLKGSGQRSER